MSESIFKGIILGPDTPALPITKEYNPDQPRDDSGRFGSGGGGGSSGGKGGSSGGKGGSSGGHVGIHTEPKPGTKLSVYDAKHDKMIPGTVTRTAHGKGTAFWKPSTAAGKSPERYIYGDATSGEWEIGPGEPGRR